MGNAGAAPAVRAQRVQALSPWQTAGKTLCLNLGENGLADSQ